MTERPFRALRPRNVAATVAAALLLAGALPAAAVGRFNVTFVQPPAELQELAAMIKEPGIIEAAAGFVNSMLRLPRDVPVVFDTCNVPNAFYDPKASRIVFCYEFLALFDNVLAGGTDLSPQEVDDAIVGSTLFFVFHEMGHALVHVLDLPITGREEDAVDDLAGLILIEVDGHEDLLSAADSFALLAAGLEASGTQLAFWDEHSLNAQRAYALTCMVFGTNPEAYAHLVHPETLPEARARRCPSEFRQKTKAWERLLDPYLTDEARD